MAIRIPIDREAVAAFCRKWQITELAFFGSVLRDDFSEQSDVDVLVTFAESAQWSLLDHQRLSDELTTILGRSVDVVSKPGLERSRNDIRRQAILTTAQQYYASAG